MNILFVILELVIISIGILMLVYYKRIYIHLLSRAESKWDHLAIGPFWYFELSMSLLGLILIVAGVYNFYLDITGNR